MTRRIFSVLTITFFAVATFLLFPASVTAETLLKPEATQQANQNLPKNELKPLASAMGM